MTETPYMLGIKDVEDIVGKKAVDALVRANEIVLVFSGGRTSDGGLAGDVRFHISKQWDV